MLCLVRCLLDYTLAATRYATGGNPSIHSEWSGTSRTAFSVSAADKNWTILAASSHPPFGSPTQTITEKRPRYLRSSSPDKTSQLWPPYWNNRSPPPTPSLAFFRFPPRRGGSGRPGPTRDRIRRCSSRVRSKRRKSERLVSESAETFGLKPELTSQVIAGPGNSLGLGRVRGRDVVGIFNFRGHGNRLHAQCIGKRLNLRVWHRTSCRFVFRKAARVSVARQNYIPTAAGNRRPMEKARADSSSLAFAIILSRSPRRPTASRMWANGISWNESRGHSFATPVTCG